MAFDPVLTGATANDGTGDPLRTAFTRINDNFDLAVEGAASSTDGTVVQFDGTTGKVVKASSVPVADIIVEGDARLTDARTPTAHGNEAHTSTFITAAGAPVQSVNTLTGAVVLDASDVGADPTGTAASEVSTHNSDTTSVHGIADTATLVIGPATATSGRVAVYADGTGKLLQDGAKLEADLLVGPASAVDDRVAVFDGVTGKLVKDSGVSIATLTSGLNFAGLWNASTNTPTLTSSVGTEGTYYVVSVAGSTNLNGVSSWTVGESALFTAGVWVKVASSFVSNPGTSTNNAVAVFDGTTGKLLKDGTGTVTAGKFSPTATTVAGNGVYLPATDAVAISTADVERLRVLATGNVGIGTATPARLLDVATDAAIHGVRVGLGAGDISSNTAVGSSALNANTTGFSNTAAGRNALLSNTTGADNTAAGVSALQSNTTGGSNTAAGRGALLFNTTGSSNTAAGRSALQSNTTGFSNTAAGRDALLSNTTGAANTAAGRDALRENTTSANNAAHGFEAGRRFVSATGAQTAVGYRALYGGSATPANNTGGENTAVGHQAGDGITTGSTNTILGHNAARGITTGSGNIAIGAAAQVDSATGSDQINIGTRYFHDRIRLLERSADPAKPAEGNVVMWMSDGTGLGDDGDVLIGSTAGGVTNYAILFDHSAGTLWP